MYPPPAPLRTIPPSREVDLGTRSTRACTLEPLREVLAPRDCPVKALAGANWHNASYLSGVRIMDTFLVLF